MLGTWRRQFKVGRPAAYAVPPDPRLTQSDALIRDAGAYADFFAAATADAPAGEWLQ